MIISTFIFKSIAFIYLLSSVLYFCCLVFQNKKLSKVALIVTSFGFVAHTAAIILRWVESYQMGIGHAPLSNLFESMVFFAWAIVLIHLFFEFKYKFKIESMGAFASPFASLAMFFACFFFDTEISPLVPALQSQWLVYHVITCFLGYGAFAVSCGASIIYLIKIGREEKNLPSRSLMSFFPDSKFLDQLNYKVIIIGFPMLTMGIITGAAWAYYAWGRYWGWDPKETWSLITWFIYAAFLHARFARGWRGKKSAILSIIGFAAVLFTYLGVNLILSGLHSYT